MNFFLDDNGALTVTIDTERLHLESVEANKKYHEAYAALFGDKEVMQKFAAGETKTREEIQDRIQNVWVKRWQQNDPYTGLAAFITDTGEFVGHVVLRHGDAPGQSELAYLFMKNHWGKGFGTEAVTAVVKEFAPATVKEGYSLDSVPLHKNTATARVDNLASVKILQKLGMHLTGQEKKYGALRYNFSISLSELTAV